MPDGAPGDERHLEVVSEKFRTEAARHLGKSQIEQAISMIDKFGKFRLEEIASHACRTESGKAADV